MPSQVSVLLRDCRSDWWCCSSCCWLLYHTLPHLQISHRGICAHAEVQQDLKWLQKQINKQCLVCLIWGKPLWRAKGYSKERPQTRRPPSQWLTVVTELQLTLWLRYWKDKLNGRLSAAALPSPSTRGDSQTRGGGWKRCWWLWHMNFSRSHYPCSIISTLYCSCTIVFWLPKHRMSQLNTSPLATMTAISGFMALLRPACTLNAGRQEQ